MNELMLRGPFKVKKLKMGNFEIKSTTIRVLLAIFRTKKYKFFCLRVLMKWEIIQYFSNLGPFWKLGLFKRWLASPPLFKLTWDFFDDTPPMLGTFPKFCHFYILKAPLSWSSPFTYMGKYLQPEHYLWAGRENGD